MLTRGSVLSLTLTTCSVFIAFSCLLPEFSPPFRAAEPPTFTLVIRLTSAGTTPMSLNASQIHLVLSEISFGAV